MLFGWEKDSNHQIFIVTFWVKDLLLMGVCEFAAQSGKGLSKVFPETIKILREKNIYIYIIKNFAKLWCPGPAQFLHNSNIRN